MGAAASKKESEDPPTRSMTAALSEGEQSGPAAMTTRPSGIDSASSLITRMRGREAISSSTKRENRSRSTARAPPAGTAARSAHAMRTDPIARSSRFNIPAAESERVDLKEFEQTSSARWSVWWAGEPLVGRISYKRTSTPLSASWMAHSQPAKPPPITLTPSNI